MSKPNTASRFDEIYNSTQKSALGFITAKCGNTADIADIFQETYMELYQILTKRGDNYIKNEKAIVLKIARQKLARHYRRAEKSAEIPLVTKGEDGEVDISELGIDAFLTEDFEVDHVTLSEAKEKIKSKPEDIKKVFYLYFELGQTIPEIAKALRLSESGVKNKLYRTLRELRELLS